MNSTTRYAWLGLVAGPSAAGLIAAATTLPAPPAPLRPATGRLAVVWTPTRTQLQQLALFRPHAPADGSGNSNAIAKPRYPPPDFRPGTHCFDYLWGSPDFLPKGPPAPFPDRSPNEK
jgi:hypothetical protein